MSIARFYSRIANAISPLIGSSAVLENFLENTAVALHAPDSIDAFPAHRAGFILAANLCARLYPRIHIIASKGLTEECATLVLQINPLCQIDTSATQIDATLAWGHSCAIENAVTVSAENWDLFVDTPKARELALANPLTTLAAGCFGVGELFRTVFSRFLQTGRNQPTAASLNLLTSKEVSPNLPFLPDELSIRRVHLVGAGAVGQAAVYALNALQLRGAITIVDPETIEVSNLQRYILSTDADVGAPKCDLVKRSLRDSKIDTTTVHGSWVNDPDVTGVVEDVCVAVDSAEVRIGIQAGLPRRIYNAWTQPADVGWSRHEDFGKKPCLACLYMPTGPRPSIHQLIATSLHQHEARVLAYILHKIAVDIPLPNQQLVMLLPQPSATEIEEWSKRSILEDIARDLRVDQSVASTWSGKQISDLYREGICGGAIVVDRVTDVPQEVAVPLAHQSAIAGIMLATELVVANCPELAELRDTNIEGRINVLAPLKQVIGRPRQKTPNCLCADRDFISRYHERWDRTP
jgi:hypothetical protein